MAIPILISYYLFIAVCLSMCLQASLSLCLARFWTMKPFLYRSGFAWELKGSLPSSGTENTLHLFWTVGLHGPLLESRVITGSPNGSLVALCNWGP